MMIDDSQSMKIELFLSCRNLKDTDVFSKSDPYITVQFKRDFTQKNYSNIGRTETIKNQLNPNYAKTFLVDYIFQSRQDIRFQLFDDDGNGKDDDYIGWVETTIGNLMGAQGQTSVLDLKDNSGAAKSGKLIVRCEKIDDSSDYFNMKMKAEKIMNVDSFFDFWDKSDPYVKLMKARNDGSFVQAKRTEVVMDSLDPSWQPFEVQVSKLVNPQKNLFKVEVWDWEEDGKDQFIGDAVIIPSQLVPGFRFEISNPKKKAGAIILQQFQIVKKPSFLDYLRGGLQLNMMVAIDFTGSNGTPKFPNSLHYMNPNSPNQYQLAINYISQILLSYDADKRIAAFGFGAKPLFPTLTGNVVNHCFPLSGTPEKLQAEGHQQLMAMYMRALTMVQLSGPTYFAPILEAAMGIALQSRNSAPNCYQTLLIITDGQIHDMDKTIDLLVQAAALPLSVIIVGVGNADFGNMNKLDGDSGLINNKGQRAQRDIVQFVPMRDLQFDGNLLAKQLLAELPNQVVQYFRLINKPPGPPIK